ncbi:MAG: hypothetical protein FWG73_03720 [Planctomycetaceae bacterium]|nr:hypothetical protein [Planctomycetaceae bacterium]
MIDNSLYRQHSDCDTLRASRKLKQLCDTGLLAMQNRGPATYYVPGPVLNETFSSTRAQQLENVERPLECTNLPPKSTNLQKESTKLSLKSTNLSSKSTKSNGNDIELVEKTEILNDDLRRRIQSLRKKEDGDVVQRLIEEICYEASMSTEELASLLGRNPKALYREHIRILVQENRLFLVNPTNKNDPKQAYTSRKE